MKTTQKTWPSRSKRRTSLSCKLARTDNSASSSCRSSSPAGGASRLARGFPLRQSSSYSSVSERTALLQIESRNQPGVPTSARLGSGRVSLTFFAEGCSWSGVLKDSDMLSMCFRFLNIPVCIEKV